jgi:LPS sulfotransferase NodH
VFVYLYRENLLSQAISWRISHLTGKWQFNDDVATPPAANPDFFDSAAIDRNIEQLAAFDANWRVFFARNGIKPYFLAYERFLANTSEVLIDIARLAGLGPEKLNLTYSEGGEHESQIAGGGSKREVLSRFLKEMQRVQVG